MVGAHHRPGPGVPGHGRLEGAGSRLVPVAARGGDQSTHRGEHVHVHVRPPGGMPPPCPCPRERTALVPESARFRLLWGESDHSNGRPWCFGRVSGASRPGSALGEAEHTRVRHLWLVPTPPRRLPQRGKTSSNRPRSGLVPAGGTVITYRGGDDVERPNGTGRRIREARVVKGLSQAAALRRARRGHGAVGLPMGAGRHHSASPSPPGPSPRSSASSSDPIGRSIQPIARHAEYASVSSTRSASPTAGDQFRQERTAPSAARLPTPW